mgnify:CR=1 FL=1
MIRGRVTEEEWKRGGGKNGWRSNATKIKEWTCAKGREVKERSAFARRQCDRSGEKVCKDCTAPGRPADKAGK